MDVIKSERGRPSRTRASARAGRVHRVCWCRLAGHRQTIATTNRQRTVLMSGPRYRGSAAGAGRFEIGPRPDRRHRSAPWRSGHGRRLAVLRPYRLVLPWPRWTTTIELSVVKSLKTWGYPNRCTANVDNFVEKHRFPETSDRISERFLMFA
jgi:hypothetical protein